MAGWLWRDIRHGFRSLRREPTFALTAILTLALGVATTTTVFSVVDAELWKPLPFADPEQLVAIQARRPNARAEAISGAELLDWRPSAPAFSGLAGEGQTTRRVLQLGTAESVLVTSVTGNFFTTLGRPAILGRTLRSGDARESRSALLTDRTWRRLFGADPSIVGRTITLDGETLAIVGVVAATDSLGGDPDLFVALDESGSTFLDRTHASFYSIIGRLRPGADPAVARQQLQAVATRQTEAATTDQPDRSIVIRDLREFFTGGNSRPLYFFLGASLIVLLLSAVNVATLLLARAFRRTREFALRGALGGGQMALARQLLVEGALLTLPAVAGAVLMTGWAVGLFTAQLPADFFTQGTSIPIDLRVCAFALLVTGLTTAGFVLAPLAMTRRVELSSALGPGVRAGRSAAEGRLRGVLLTAQIALTVVLLAGAGIFLKSFVALTRVPLGFDPANTLAVRASLSGPRYANDAAVRAYGDRLIETARSTPGVQDAAIGTGTPLGSGPIVPLATAAAPRPRPGEELDAIMRGVSPDYFRTLGIRILRGRGFSAADVTGAPRVAIVNEGLAREAFGEGDPVGQIIELLPGARAPWTNQPGPLVVVGVVGNVKDVGLNEVNFGNIYVPFAQMSAARMELVVRGGISAGDVIAPLRDAVARIDPGVPVTSAATFDERIAIALRGDRFNLLLISSFAAVALLLAAVGVYGAVAYHVQARTRELGVRLALGAGHSRLIGAAVWQTGRLGVLGASLGVGIVLAIARVIGDALYLVRGSHNGLLYGVTTTDPVMLASAFVGVSLVTLVAGAIPARRVTRINPIQALGSD